MINPATREKICDVPSASGTGVNTSQPWSPKHNMKTHTAFMVAFVLAAFSGVPAHASTYTVHGPLTYTRSTGAPVTLVETFTVANPTGEFTLTINNQTVSSASIKLNGVEVVKGSDFNQNTRKIVREISLQASNQLSVELRGKPGETLTLSITGEQQEALLKARAFEFDADAPDSKGPPLAAGVTIRIDGADVGVTDETGALTVVVQPGEHEVTGILPGKAIGSSTFTGTLGQTANVDLLLDFDKEVIEETDLACDEVTGSRLDATFSSLTLRFTRNGATLPMKAIDAIDLVRADGSPISILDGYFEVTPEGAIRATHLPALRAQLEAQQAAITLRVMASDEGGLVHANKLTFYLARFRVTGALTAPPSAPALNVEGITVQLTVLGTPLTFTTVSGPGGAFEFTRIPRGLLSFNASTLQNGQYYYGQGQTLISYSLAVNLRMRGQVDIINGVPPISVGPGPSAESSSADETTPLPAPGAPPRTRGAPPPWETTAPQPQEVGPVSRTVVASTQNLTISQTGVLDVPQGTKTVTLKYNIYTAEWPYYVVQQSVYNDIWSISVMGGAANQQFFNITRNVNSQWLMLPPYWQVDGSTGTIQEKIDVSALTANQPIQLTLLITSMNVGDSLLPTYVTATLGAGPALTIDTVTADAPTFNTVNDGSYYSIPRPGQTNHYTRTFKVQYTKPTNAQITTMRVALKNLSTNQELMTVLEEGIGTRVVQVNDTTLRVHVTMHQFPSSVQSIPPPTDEIAYSFRLTATENGQESQSDPKDSQRVRPLWRMPDGIARYSPPALSPGGPARDTGGDDWCRQSTYTWLLNNFANITSVNDISGEHGKNIGHTTHGTGLDIDIYHFHTFPGSTNAESNYQALVTRAQQVLSAGAQPALQDITTWVAAMRQGLATLVVLPEVHRLYATIGSPVSVTVQRNGQPVTVTLASGWAKALIRTGSVTASDGTVIQTNLGQWAHAGSAQITYNDVHDNHVHIALR
jgi:hypothetical protein